MPDWFHPEDIAGNVDLLRTGLLTTLLLALAVIVTSFTLGMVIAVIRYCQIPVLAKTLAACVYFIRSIPVIMILVLVHYGILPALDVPHSFFFSAYLGLSISTIAYVSEILRGGFQALRAEEAETAVSLGLTFRQRLLYILVPLVTFRMTPALVNQFVTLIKDTSLASIIGVIELTRAAELIYERTFHELTLLMFVAAVYFLLCYGLSRWAKQLEFSTPRYR